MTGFIRTDLNHLNTRVITIFLLFLFTSAYTQDSAQVDLNPDVINIFIDSPDWRMDLDYYRTEIPFVNYMRDRSDADVHILITTQRTGGDGWEFTISFIGLHKFEGQKNTLKYSSRQTDSEDTIRKELARYFKIGLMQFVSQSQAVGQIDVIYLKPTLGETLSQPTVDPWDYWTFRTSLRGYFNGEKSYKYNYINSSFTANRVTEAWKFNVNLSINQTQTIYNYGDNLSYTDHRRSNYLSSSVVKSMTAHWSSLFQVSAAKSTYNNYDLAVSISPGIEYNIYPYSEATRQQFTFEYLLGAHYNDYHEKTIYLKMSELRFTQELNIAYESKQPWGSVSTSLNGSHYFHDIKKYNLTLHNSLDLKLIKGFSLNLNGFISHVRDQLSLPGAGVTFEEILLRRRELETSYYYYMSIGLSYTFGSIYNNVVNPRFGG